MAINKYGHFAKAAEASHITQPTLSMQIQKLEEDLGVKIFDRSKKPIIATSIGKKLIEQFQLILLESRKVEQLIQSYQTHDIEGELQLAVIPTLAPYVLPTFLPLLEKSHPGIQLKIQELQTHRIIEALNSDEVDVGLLVTPLKIPSIHEYPLFYEPFSVLCKNNHELSNHKKLKYSELSHSDIWLLEEGHCLRNQVLDVCALKKNQKVKAKYQFESGSLETLKSLVDNYGGYTLLPALAANVIGNDSKLVNFERPIPAREVGLIYRREHYKRDLIEVVGETIIASIPDKIRKIRPKDLDVIPV
ncbi:MAG: transcriptional regulator [Proteobacteria bacterium SG_bin7]|nr:MAG: transcriptional regulator [Proteobacteria bacterium SG_bin7]